MKRWAGLAAVLVLATAGCGPSPSTHRPGLRHRTYTYTGIANPAKSVWHPGETVAVTVAPQRGPATVGASPARVSLTLALDGPYVSVAALKAAATGDTFGVGVGLRTTPVTTDTWSGQTLTGSLALPTTLQPGYYNLRESVQRTDAHGSVTSSGDMVLQVAS